MRGLLTGLVILAATFLFAAQAMNITNEQYRRMANRIVSALAVQRGERVMIRFDPQTNGALEPLVRGLLETEGAMVESIPYGSVPDFDRKLNASDIYIWLPAGPNAPPSSDQASALIRWLDEGRGRQIHFHWGDGTRGVDGLGGVHSAAYDVVYLAALDIDYRSLDRHMERAIEKLRSGEVRVRTPAGTDIRFRVGDRPFCKQNGDASKARMATARVRVDREIELPAGALRVAPIEGSVEGKMALPRARFGDGEVGNAMLEFSKGEVVRVSAAENQQALTRYLDSAPGARRFRELAIGFNSRLVKPGGARWVPYYGYGAGVVRMGLGDNTELGGQVRGGAVRWLFFEDATVSVGDEVLIDRGQLKLKP